MNEWVFDQILCDFSAVFVEDNPNFDEGRFREACGQEVGFNER